MIAAISTSRHNQTRCLLLALLLLSAAFTRAAEDARTVDNTPHNLSVSGTGDVRSPTENEICIFCHAPHAGDTAAPLWNHQTSQAVYTPYSSSTLKATVGQPTGASKLCLSCHDGTVALGTIVSRRTPIPMRSGAASLRASSRRLGTDLSGHHPISFTYDPALAATQGELRDPRALNREVRTDSNQQVQCTSCHNPHNNLYGKFLVKNNTASALCLDCHVPKNWSTSAHATSQATWKGIGRNPWPHATGKTVADNGCENCHTPHDAGTKPHLLNFAKAEDNCLVCHDGSVAAKNIASEVTKPSAHALSTATARHDATRGPLSTTAQTISCVDCHSPHAVQASSTASDGVIAGALTRVKGLSAAGGVVPTATHEYEVCFRCHADTASRGMNGIPRQFSQSNIRIQFSPANASFHPILAAAKSTHDRTLISPWTTSRRMNCTDCHNNDQGPGANGTGARGPHGSRHSPLLERKLVQEDFQFESASAYALCYKCHNQGILMADRLHSRHVRDLRTACTTCHDPHGVQNRTHLVNFNTIYVKPLNGQTAYTEWGGGRSSCTLTCHERNHDGLSYRP